MPKPFKQNQYHEPADPDGPEFPRPEPTPNTLNILGLRNLVYLSCAAIILICLTLALLALWYR